MGERLGNNMMDPADLSGSPVTTPMWEGGMGAYGRTIIKRSVASGGAKLATYHRQRVEVTIGNKTFLMDEWGKRTDLLLIKPNLSPEVLDPDQGYRHLTRHSGIILNNGDEVLFPRAGIVVERVK